MSEGTLRALLREEGLWREEGPRAWSLRLIPNPLGLELYIEGGSAGDWIWHIFATTPDDAAEVTCGDAESLEEAMGEAEAKARELLSALRSDVAKALAVVSP